MTVRNVFIISPAKRVELILTYPAYVGRNFDEILRVLDALQLSARHHVATPANWQPGDDTVVLPFISDEEAERMFADKGGLRKVRPTCATSATRRCASSDLNGAQGSGERVVGCSWNGRSDVHGIGGRITVEHAPWPLRL